MNKKGDVLTVLLIWTAAMILIPGTVDLVFDVSGRRAQAKKQTKDVNHEEPTQSSD